MHAPTEPPCPVLDWSASPAQVEHVTDLLAAGGLVAFPTDTVWGVGARADSPEGVEALYALKGKRRDQPLPCLVASAADALALFDAPPARLVRLADTFWPGALTVVAPVRPEVLPLPRAGAPTLGVRVPDCPPLLALLAALPTPLASSSANLHGAPPLETAAAVQASLGDDLAAILSWEQKFAGVASTVVALERDRLVVLRGGHRAREIETML